jgi:uncharacterized membrane protein
VGHISVTETIRAPIDTVFAYVDDYRNTTRYMKDLVKWEPAGSTTHGKGSRFALAMKAGPLSIEGEVEITTWTDRKAIGWTTRKGFRQDGAWSFRQRGDSTEATFEVEYELPGGFAGRVMAKAAEPILKGNLEASVRQLKAQTEGLAKKG